jgi:enamine deaminase RidA (YjgF/YER057c/UK114 family)
MSGGKNSRAAGLHITPVLHVDRVHLREIIHVFLSNMDDFAEMNSVYMQYWGDVKPCRT